MRRLLPILLLLSIPACLTTKQAGVPNLRCVDSTKAIWRGGQPVTVADWAVIMRGGCSNVVKLNMDSEGSDAFAESVGMKVQRFGITTAEQFLGGDGLSNKVAMAVASIGPGTYVHCQHGQDRTGVVCAEYRVRAGWSRQQAETEMLADGFHKSLHGLWEAWEQHKQDQ